MTQKFRTILIFILLIFQFCFSAVSSQTLSFQGKLLDNNGATVTATKVMTFTLYPQSTGGTAVPNATWTQPVVVQNGIYAVELDVSAVDLSIVSEAWMEVTVAGETLTPRIHLTSSAFARRAAQADTAKTLQGVVNINGSNVGIGTISPSTSLDVKGIVSANNFFVGSAPIVESGSNANGSWIKYADGTLICATDTMRLNAQAINTGTSAIWIFPVAFSSPPFFYYSVIAEQGAGSQAMVGIQAYNGVYSGTSSTQATLMSHAYRSETSEPVIYRGLAVGRWK
jgi:hypothetical protein